MSGPAVHLEGYTRRRGGGTVDQGRQIDPLPFHGFFKGKLMILKGFLKQFYEVSVMHKAFMSWFDLIQLNLTQSNVVWHCWSAQHQ